LPAKSSGNSNKKGTNQGQTGPRHQGNQHAARRPTTVAAVDGAAASTSGGTGDGDPDLEATDKVILDLLGVNTLHQLPAASFPCRN
jgi:hypothetical protein